MGEKSKLLEPFRFDRFAKGELHPVFTAHSHGVDGRGDMNDAASTSRSTDIERFVDDPQRKELVKEVRKKIDELGIDYIYLQFVSVTGRIMGKGIPADHWESVAKGFQLRLRRHREPVPQPPRRLSRLRPGSHGVGRHSRSPRRSCSSPGTSGWRGCGARCSGTARSARTLGAYLTADARGTSAASTSSSRKSTGWSFVTAQSPR